MEIETRVNVETFLKETLDPQALAEPLPDEIARAVVERLNQEADRHLSIDPRRSLEFAGRIVAISRARGDISQTALGLMRSGDALNLTGRPAEAWEAFKLAGEMFKAAGDEVGWARTRIGRLYLSKMFNRVAQALAECEKAREILVRYGEDEILLRLERSIAYIYNNLGEMHKALEHYQAALSIAERLGEAGEDYFGMLYISLGSTFEGLGELRQAQDYYERAYAVLMESDEVLYLANVEANIAYLAQKQGNYRRALQLFDRALKRVEEHTYVEATKIRWHILECYVALNRHTEARDLARQVAAAYRELDNPYELALTLLELGTIEAERSDYGAAQAALDEAEDVFASLEASSLVALTWLRRSRIALQRGDADRAHRQASAAAEAFAAAGQQIELASAFLVQGQACLAQGELQAAQAAARIALQLAQRDNLPALRYRAHLLLGQAHARQAEVRRAERHFQAASATIERVQRGLTITMQPGFLEDKAEAWRALIGLYLDEDRTAKAFESLERAKSQVLLGYLANRERLRWARQDETSRALIEELDHLRAEHQWFYRLAHEPRQEHDEAGLPDSQQALAEVRLRERRMRAITEQLYLYSAQAQTPNPAPTPRAGEVQAALDGNTRLVEFYNDGQQLWAFTLDRESLEIRRLPARPEELNRLLAQLQTNLAAALRLGPQAAGTRSLGVLAQRILQRMHVALIEPLDLQRRSDERLLIVPFGALHYLPFHLLYDGSAYLIEGHEIAILPAAGLALQPGPRRQPGARVLAHTWEGRLPYTRREASLVLERFGGSLHAEETANRAAFEAPPVQILHVAAHGQYRLDQPDLSYLQLADGQLYADDLLQQDLSYELVTLSACETGRANVSGGDELIGLGRGFLYAGAGALVLSQWRVPDDTTMRLMEGMYTALQEGASKAGALRVAQLQILAEAEGLHPAFWGAFQLVGDARPLTKGMDRS